MSPINWTYLQARNNFLKFKKLKENSFVEVYRLLNQIMKKTIYKFQTIRKQTTLTMIFLKSKMTWPLMKVTTSKNAEVN